MKITNPYYARRSSGLPNGGGISVPVGGGSRGGVPGLDGIGNAIAATIGAATYDETTDPRAQAARKYGLEADNLQDERAGRGGIAELFGNIDFSNPEALGQTVRELGAAVTRSGGNPDSMADMFRFIASNSPGTSEDQVGRAHAGAGGGATGLDQGFTQGGKDRIRDLNFGQETSINDADNRQSGANNAATNAQSGANNTATIAGAMDRAILEEDGRNGRRFDDPVTVSPSATAYPAPGDPRFPSGSVTAPPKPGEGKDDKPPLDITPAETKTIDELIGYEIPEGAKVDPGVRMAVTARAGEIYQETRNAAGAVRQAIDERMQVTPDVGMFWDGPSRVTLKGPAGAGGGGGGGGDPDAENQKLYPGAPAIGTKKSGYTYQGGEPSDPNNWPKGDAL
jgi:hypothetical protein